MEPRERKLNRLLNRIKRAPHNTRFAELCELVETAGIPFKRRSSSQSLYEDETEGIFLNLQPGQGGKAKGYQVRQVVETIEDLLLARMKDKEDES